MDPFSDTGNWVARQFHSLKSQLQQSDLSVRARCELAVASIRVTLLVYPKPRLGTAKPKTNEGRCPAVRVELRDHDGSLIAAANPRQHESPIRGQPFPFKLSRSRAVLTIHGVDESLKASHYLPAYLDEVANLIDRAVLTTGWQKHLAAPGIQSTPPMAPAARDYDQRLSLCQVFLDHLDGLSTGLRLHRQHLRWAWLTRTQTGEKMRPFILYHLPRHKETPWLMNPKGEEGLLHSVIGTGGPSLIWNFTDDPAWDLPKDRKEAFFRTVDIKAQPHLFYLPVSRRLAGQIIFGDDCDHRAIFDLADQLRPLAATAVSLAFKDAVYFHLLQLRVRLPNLNFREIKAGSKVATEVERLLVDLCDLYPVQGIRFNSSLPGEQQFVVTTDADGAAQQLAKTANAAAAQAWNTLGTMAEAEEWRSFGTTFLGINHTARRPLDYMLGFVNQVTAGAKLGAELSQKSTDAKQFLERLRILYAIENAHLTVVTQQPPAERKSMAANPIRHLAELGYFGSNHPKHIPASGEIECTDLIWQQRVRFVIDAESIYLMPPASLALIIAELADNAGRYVSTHCHYMPDFSQNEAAIEIRLIKGVIIAKNRLVPGAGRITLGRLDHALKMRLQGSANKVKSTAALFGYGFHPETPTPHELRIVLSHDEPK